MAKANLKKVAAGFAALAMMAAAVPANVFSTDYLATVSAAETFDASKVTFKSLYADPHEVSHVKFDFFTDSNNNGVFDKSSSDVYTKNPACGNSYVAHVFDPTTGNLKIKDVYLKYDTDGRLKFVDGASLSDTNDTLIPGYTLSVNSGIVSLKKSTSGTVNFVAADTTATDPATNAKYKVTISGVDYYYGNSVAATAAKAVVDANSALGTAFTDYTSSDTDDTKIDACKAALDTVVLAANNAKAEFTAAGDSTLANAYGDLVTKATNLKTLIVSNNGVSANTDKSGNYDSAFSALDPGVLLEDGELYKYNTTSKTIESVNTGAVNKIEVVNASGSKRKSTYEISGDTVSVKYSSSSELALATNPVTAGTGTPDLPATINIDDAPVATNNLLISKKIYKYGNLNLVAISTKTNTSKANWYEVTDNGDYYIMDDQEAVGKVLGTLETDATEDPSNNASKITLISVPEDMGSYKAEEYTPVKYAHDYSKKVSGVINSVDDLKINTNDRTVDVTFYTKALDAAGSKVLYTNEACTEFSIPDADIVCDGEVVGKRVYEQDSTIEKQYKITDVYEASLVELGDEAKYENKVTYTLASKEYTRYMKAPNTPGASPLVYVLYKDKACTDVAENTLYLDTTAKTVKIGSVLETTFAELVAEKNNVKLEADVHLTKDIKIDYDAVIDLNGNDITAETGVNINVADGATLTVINTGAAKNISAIKLLGANSNLKLYKSTNNLTLVEVIATVTDGKLNGVVTNSSAAIAKYTINIETDDWESELNAVNGIQKKIKDAWNITCTPECHVITTQKIDHDVWIKAGVDNYGTPTKVYNKYGLEIDDKGKVANFDVLENGKVKLSVNANASVGDTTADIYSDATHHALGVLFATSNASIGKYDVIFDSIAHEGFEYAINSTTHTISCSCAASGAGTKEPHEFEVLGTVGGVTIAKCKVCGYVTTLSSATAEVMGDATITKNDSELPYVQKYSFAISGGEAAVQSYGVLYNKTGAAIDTKDIKVVNGKIDTSIAHSTKNIIKKSGTYSISVGTKTADTGVTVIPYVVVGDQVTFGAPVGDKFENIAAVKAEENAAITLTPTAAAGKVTFAYDIAVENGYTIKNYGVNGKSIAGNKAINTTKDVIKTFGTYTVNVTDAKGATLSAYLTVVDPFGLEHTLKVDSTTINAK